MTSTIPGRDSQVGLYSPSSATNVTSATTVDLAQPANKFKFLAFTFYLGSNSTSNRAVVLVSAYQINSLQWYAAAASSLFGAIRLYCPTENDSVNYSKMTISAHSFTALYLYRISGIP